MSIDITLALKVVALPLGILLKKYNSHTASGFWCPNESSCQVVGSGSILNGGEEGRNVRSVFVLQGLGWAQGTRVKHARGRDFDRITVMMCNLVGLWERSNQTFFKNSMGFLGTT